MSAGAGTRIHTGAPHPLHALREKSRVRQGEMGVLSPCHLLGANAVEASVPCIPTETPKRTLLSLLYADKETALGSLNKMCFCDPKSLCLSALKV